MAAFGAVALAVGVLMAGAGVAGAIRDARRHLRPVAVG
jgi:hypothetical protein